MDYLDLDSFRSRYSDITVTAVPAKPQVVDEQEAVAAGNCNGIAAGSGAEMAPAARVEIIPINSTSVPCQSLMMQHQQQLQLHQQQQQQQQLQLQQQLQQQQLQLQLQQQFQQQQQQQQLQFNQEAAAYSNEYQQVLAKLEYTKYVQAQLQLISNNNGFGELLYGMPGNQMQLPSSEANGAAGNGNGNNIVETYDNLLSVIAEMQSNLGPTAIGLRAPKERLLRDIAHARVLVRECILMLMRDNQQQPPSDE